MRKIFIILTLIVSSFFILNNDVKADTLTYTVDPSHFDYINDEFYLLREKVIEYCNENNMHYVIQYQNGLFAYIFNTDYGFVGYNSPLIYFKVDYSATKYIVTDGVLVSSGSTTSITSTLVGKNATVFDYSFYIDTNLENVLYTGRTAFDITYNDSVYSIDRNIAVPTLYQVYLENVPQEPEDPHLEEKEILSNFYTTVITKIGELANNVFNNYVLLFSIGIFIFVFVFEIIFRRLL